VKIDVSQPLTYASVVGVLLAIRVVVWAQMRRRKRESPTRAANAGGTGTQ